MLERWVHIWIHFWYWTPEISPVSGFEPVPFQHLLAYSINDAQINLGTCHIEALDGIGVSEGGWGWGCTPSAPVVSASLGVIGGVGMGGGHTLAGRGRGGGGTC